MEQYFLIQGLVRDDEQSKIGMTASGALNNKVWMSECLNVQNVGWDSE